MTAATEVWTKSEDLTDAQKAIPVVARWEFIEKVADGSMKSVNVLDGTMGMLTGKAVELQELRLGDVAEVREGKTRDEDCVVLYRRGTWQ